MYSFTLHTKQDQDLIALIEEHGTTSAVKMAMRAYLKLQKGESVNVNQDLSEEQLNQIVQLLQTKMGKIEQSATLEDSEQPSKKKNETSKSKEEAVIDSEEVEKIYAERGKTAGALNLTFDVEN